MRSAVVSSVLASGDPVFGYLRDSGGRGQELSVERQRGEVQAWADARGLAVLGWWADEARRAADVARRAQLLALVTECERRPPPVRAVLVWSLSRWTRSERETDDAQYLKFMLRRNGVDLVSVSDPIPPGEFSRAFEMFFDTFNRLENERRGMDIRSGQERNVAAGLAHGGRPPVGYLAERVAVGGGRHRDGSERLAPRWVVDPVRAPLVRQAFEMYARGCSIMEVHEVTRLYESYPAYTKMLANLAYTGVLRYGDLRLVGAFPALVDGSTWDVVQERRAHRIAPRAVNSVYLLSGLIWCGWCGTRMTGSCDYVRKDGTRLAYYTCRHREKFFAGERRCEGGSVRVDEIEAQVVDDIARRVLEPEALAELLAELRTGPDVGQEIVALDLEIERVARVVGNLLDVAEVGPGPETARRLRDREAELAGLRARRAGLAARAEAVVPDVGRLAALVDQWRRGLAGDALERKRVVQVLVQRVTWGPERVLLEYRVAGFRV